MQTSLRLLLSLAGLALLAWPLNAQTTAGAIRLPEPTGSFSVAVRRFEWSDPGRRELDTLHATQPRRLLVRVWYPALSGAGSSAAYLPLAHVYRELGIVSDAAVQRAATVVHHASDAAPVAKGTQKFPVVLFSGGNGEIETMYTALLEELASHGFVIAQVVHPGVAHAVFSNGDVVRRYHRLYDPKPAGWDSTLKAVSPSLNRAVYDSFYTEAAAYLLKDLSFVLDQLTALDAGADGGWLKSRLDLTRVVSAGHSYGALVAAEQCGRDARVRACVLFDGATFGGLREEGLAKPVMLFRPAWINNGTGRGVSQDQMFGSLKADGYDVNIPGAEHRSFMDAHFLNPASRSTPATPERVLAIVSAYTRAFLNRYLYGRTARLLEGPSTDYPDVHLRIFKSYLPPAPATSNTR